METIVTCEWCGGSGCKACNYSGQMPPYFKPSKTKEKSDQKR